MLALQSIVRGVLACRYFLMEAHALHKGLGRAPRVVPSPPSRAPLSVSW